MSPNPPKFNKLFPALYDLMFSKLTNVGYMVPSPTRTLKEIFQEKSTAQTSSSSAQNSLATSSG